MERKAVSGIMVTLLLTSIFTMAFSVGASQSVIEFGIRIYWDDNFIEPVYEVDWDRVKHGSNKSITVFIRNEGNVNVTLFLSSSNWNPPEAASYVHLTWNYTGEILEPFGVLPVTFSLYVDVDLEGIPAVSFDAIVGAYGSLATTVVIPMTASIVTTWTVDDDGPADFHRIQDAINAANDGDTIYVHNGTYYENVVVSRSITLVGENKSSTIIDGNYTGYTIHVQSTSNVNITNFTIKRGYGGFGCSIFVESSINITITNNTITGGQTAIRAHYSNVNIERNEIIDNSFFGIRLFEYSNGSITSNTLLNNFFGIGISHSGGFTIHNNTLVNDYGGISLFYSTNCVLKNNNITNNEIGISVEDSSNNIFYHNNFNDNTIQVFSYDSTSVWDDGYPSGGNYWSDYDDTDLYTGPYQNETGSDGIGDTPYFIDGNNQDNYPLMNPWTSAPPTAAATADVVPNTLNLKSKGEWITCYIELPEDLNASDIDIYSIMLNDTFPASLLTNPPVPVPTEIGDYDYDGVPDLMVKFNRTALASIIYHTLGIMYGNVTLTITGNLTDGTRFEGSDTVKVIFGGDADLSGLVELDDYDIWLDNYGKKPNKCPPNVYPDFNNDGLVDMLDFFVWRENFGATVPPQP